MQDKGILLTTYDIVRFNTKQLCGSGLYDEDCDDGPLWDYMILDEVGIVTIANVICHISIQNLICKHAGYFLKLQMPFILHDPSFYIWFVDMPKY